MVRAARPGSWRWFHDGPVTSPLVEQGVADGPHGGVNALVTSLPLVDHHVHSIVAGEVGRASFVGMLSETDRPAAADATGMDSQVGVAVRRWCAPLLGLEPHVPPNEYLEHRLALPNEQVAARLLPHAGLERMLVDTGYRAGELLPPT